MKNVALVLGGLLFGGMLAVLAIRPGLAQEPHEILGLARWQQFCEPAASVQEASRIASARGAEGWELVAFADGAICFKRPVAPPKRDISWPGY